MPEIKGVWRVVLVGAGRMGKNHLRVLEETSEFKLVGVVDPMVNSIPESTLPRASSAGKIFPSACVRIVRCSGNRGIDTASFRARIETHRGRKTSTRREALSNDL